jgi:hypothetical protein
MARLTPLMASIPRLTGAKKEADSPRILCHRWILPLHAVWTLFRHKNVRIFNISHMIVYGFVPK